MSSVGSRDSAWAAERWGLWTQISSDNPQWSHWEVQGQNTPQAGWEQLGTARPVGTRHSWTTLLRVESMELTSSQLIVQVQGPCKCQQLLYKGRRLSGSFGPKSNKMGDRSAEASHSWKQYSTFGGWFLQAGLSQHYRHISTFTQFSLPWLLKSSLPASQSWKVLSGSLCILKCPNRLQATSQWMQFVPTVMSLKCQAATQTSHCFKHFEEIKARIQLEGWYQEPAQPRDKFLG